MKSITIGISGSMMFEEKDKFFWGFEYAYIANNYIQAVSKSGATPIVIPIIEDDEQIENQVKLLDGLVLSGGYDVDPYFYNEEPMEKLQGIYPKRDIFELKLIKLAFKYKIPILGICRGLQILNVALGGNLYQDLSYRPNSFVKHCQDAEPSQCTQSIEISENSLLFEISKNNKNERVNSFHHLAVKDLAENLKAVAVAKDGVVEAVEYNKDGMNILALQFHPEMTFENSEFSRNIFKKFISICSENK